jgi:PAS domain S-box-containing protein
MPLLQPRDEASAAKRLQLAYPLVLLLAVCVLAVGLHSIEHAHEPDHRAATTSAAGEAYLDAAAAFDRTPSPEARDALEAAYARLAEATTQTDDAPARDQLRAAHAALLAGDASAVGRASSAIVRISSEQSITPEGHTIANLAIVGAALLALVAIGAFFVQPAITALRRHADEQMDRLRASSHRADALAALAERRERDAALRVAAGEIATAVLETGELDAAIDDMLRRSGELLSVSRAYLFRIRQNGERMHNTHEWCAPGVEPQIEAFENVPTAEYADWIEALYAGAPLIVEDMRTAEHLTESTRNKLLGIGIQAALALPVWIEGRLEGFVGFDQCDGPRAFNQQDISLLREMVHTLSRAVERRIAARRLRTSEERLEIAMSIGSLAAWEWDLSIARIERDDSWYTTFGVDPSTDDNSVTFWRSKVHPDDLPAVDAALDAHLAGRADLFESHYRFLLPGGRTVWVHDRGSIVSRSPDGAPLRMVGLMRDESVEVEAARALRDSEERLRRFVANMPVAVAMFDREMRYLAASKGWIDQYGLRGVKLLGVSHYEVFPEVPDRWREEHRMALAGEVRKNPRDPFERGDSEPIWLNWELHPWRDRLGEIGGIVMFTDIITDRVMAERELKEARENAERASEAKTRFLAAMSHELRTPLTAVLGYAEMLAGNAESSGASRGALLAKVRRNGELLLRLIDDALDLSRIEAGKIEVHPAPTDLAGTIARAAEIVAPAAAAKGLSLHAAALTDVPRTVVTDEIRLRQILVNLLTNAVKFTRRGSVRVGVATRGPNLVITVTDSGPGVPAGREHLVFEPFERLPQRADTPSPDDRGSGLGLAICQRLAHELGGFIAFASSPDDNGDASNTASHASSTRAQTGALPRDTGSVFTVILPLEAAGADIIAKGPLDEAGPNTAPPPPPLEPQLAGRRVLLAEDGDANAEIIAFFLSGAGARVHRVADGEAAIEAMHNPPAGQRPDLIIMDMQMPRLSGLDATGRLREAGCDIPIVALTAYSGEEEREAATRAGASRFVTKPLDPELLISTCAELLKHAPPAAHTQNGTNTKGSSPRNSTAPTSSADAQARLRAMVAEYIGELPARAEELSAAAHAGDIEKLRHIAHQLSGSAGNFGLPLISTRAAALCDALRSGESHAAPLAALLQLLLNPPEPVLPRLAQRVVLTDTERRPPAG